MKKHGRWVNQTLLRPLRRHRATGAQRSTVLPQQITGNVLRERGRVPYFLMPDYEQSGFTASLHPACPARSPFHAPLRQRGRFSGYPRPDAWNSPSHLRGFAREAVSFMHLSSRVAAKDAKFCPDTCNSPSRLRGFAREIVLLSTPGSSRVAAKSRPVAGRPRDCRDRWFRGL